MRSGRHQSGFTLRFPRIARLRPDKAAADCDTLATVQVLWSEFQHGAEHLVTRGVHAASPADAGAAVAADGQSRLPS
jgi:DNA ligase-1